MAGVVGFQGLRKVRAPVDGDSDRSISGQVVEASSKWIGQLDQLGRRLGDRASAAPAAARRFTHNVASASTRTATWFLGR